MGTHSSYIRVLMWRAAAPYVPLTGAGLLKTLALLKSGRSAAGYRDVGPDSFLPLSDVMNLPPLACGCPCSRGDSRHCPLFRSNRAGDTPFPPARTIVLSRMVRLPWTLTPLAKFRVEVPRGVVLPDHAARRGVDGIKVRAVVVDNSLAKIRNAVMHQDARVDRPRGTQRTVNHDVSFDRRRAKAPEQSTEGVCTCRESGTRPLEESRDIVHIEGRGVDYQMAASLADSQNHFVLNVNRCPSSR